MPNYIDIVVTTTPNYIDITASQPIYVDVNYGAGSQDLQSVTSVGSLTTHAMTVESSTYFSVISPTDVGTQKKSNGSYAYISGDGLLGLSNGTVESDLKVTNTTRAITLEFPDKAAGSYTIATMDDLSTISGGIVYKGSWNANTNSPALVSSVGVANEYYIVSVAGTTNLNGVIDWNVGDWAIFIDGTTNQWQKIDNHDTQSYNFIQDEGASLPQQNTIDFQGAGVTATNGTGKTIVTIPGTIPSTSYGLYSQTALGTAITNTITETSLIGSGVGTLSVPANAFKVGDSFSAKICGNLSCANNETINVKIKSNGVVIADAGVFLMKITTDKHFELLLDFTVTKIGAAGVAELFVNGQYSYNQNANTTLDGVNFALISNTTFNTTITNTLTITAQWGSAKTANSIQSQNFVLQKIY
jgi:hypothetical protein